MDKKKAVKETRIFLSPFILLVTYRVQNNPIITVITFYYKFYISISRVYSYWMMPLCNLKDDSLTDQIFSKFRGKKGKFVEYNSYNYDNQSDLYHKLTKHREGPSVKCKKKRISPNTRSPFSFRHIITNTPFLYSVPFLMTLAETGKYTSLV